MAGLARARSAVNADSEEKPLVGCRTDSGVHAALLRSAFGPFRSTRWRDRQPAPPQNFEARGSRDVQLGGKDVSPMSLLLV